MFLVQAVEKKIDLVCRIDDRTPSHVRSDEIRIRQVLFNLVGNAIKFTGKGEVNVRVYPKGLGTGTDGFDLCLEVSDTGIGIPEDKLAVIFEPFTQADGSYTRKYGGTGLGMSIVKRLVELMRGTVQVESEVGVGTTFRVEIPVIKEEPATSSEKAIPSDVLQSVSNLRILLAEDDFSNQLVARRMLEKQGHTVTCVGTGKEVLGVLEKDGFDLILMDIQMPEMDGIEATQEIRKDERFRNLPVIALTAHAMAGDRERFLDAGMDDYLSKPIDMEELQRVLGKVMGR